MWARPSRQPDIYHTCAASLLALPRRNHGTRHTAGFVGAEHLPLSGTTRNNHSIRHGGAPRSAVKSGSPHNGLQPAPGAAGEPCGRWTRACVHQRCVGVGVGGQRGLAGRARPPHCWLPTAAGTPRRSRWRAPGGGIAAPETPQSRLHQRPQQAGHQPCCRSPGEPIARLCHCAPCCTAAWGLGARLQLR